MEQMQDVVLIEGARTPIGRFGGSLKDISASQLGSIVIKEAISRSGIRESDVEEVVMGNSIQVTESGYAARKASLGAGIPESVPTIAVNRQCSSGLEAINIAAQMIKAGEIDVAVAGGLENMSQSPFLLEYKARFDGLRLGDANMKDSLIEALGCPINLYHMGVTAENVAERFEVSREDQDELALISHTRAVQATKDGKFLNQIINVDIPQRKGEPVAFGSDEGPREDTTLERLSSLKPVFKKDGTVTAGNASSINDGAAAVVLMSRDKAKSLGITPQFRWYARGVAGVEPAIMGIGPVPAVRKALQKASMDINDIDLVELNEAFAAQALYCIRELGLDMEKTNVNGSGISLGHPVGATGAIMTVKLMDELKTRNKSIGLVTMCVGGGQGVATIFERLA